jgi:SagB-type dehydrogenase family enzyme
MKLESFENADLGISGVVPEGWAQRGPGEVARDASPIDPTALFQQGFASMSVEELKAGLLPHLGIDVFPEPAGSRETQHLNWDLYAYERQAPEMEPVMVDIALAQAGGRSFVVGLVTLVDEHETLHRAVFLPAVDALSSPFADEAYVSEIERHQAKHDRLVREAREVFRADVGPDFPAISDQDRGIPMPPPQKPYDESAPVFDLPQPDKSTIKKAHILECFFDRKSHRTYTAESLDIRELAYLLWATQGVRQIMPGGRTYRNVPSGGARHPFETYVAVNRVDGLAPGVYRYLPLQHRLVFLFAVDGLPEKLTALANGQAFVGRAAMCLIWSAVPYRTEWRYGLYARKDILIEAGHVCQNLYLACESIRCGTCAIAAYDQNAIDAFLGLDGEDEMVVYLAPVGRVKLE